MCVNGINGYSEIHNSEKYFKGTNKRKTTEGIFVWIYGTRGWLCIVDGNVWNHLLSNIYGARHISLFNNNNNKKIPEIVDVVAVAVDDVHHHIAYRFCVFAECQAKMEIKGENNFNENVWFLFKR